MQRHLLLEPVRSTLAYGQVNIVLMALVALDCLTAEPRWPRGALTGLAAALKLTPAAFVLFFLLRRDYRAAATAGVSFRIRKLDEASNKAAAGALRTTIEVKERLYRISDGGPSRWQADRPM